MKLKERLLFSYFCVALLPLLICGAALYFIERGHIEKQVIDHLTSVASIQYNRIHSAQQNEFDMFRSVASRTQLRALVSRYNESPHTFDEFSSINRILNDALVGISRYRSIRLYGLNGELISGTNTSSPLIYRALNELSSDYKLDVSYSDSGELVMNVYGPVLLDSETIGHMAIEVLPDSMLSLVQDYTGLGETGETVVASRNKDGDAVFITPTRHNHNSALNIVIPKDNLNIPIIHALNKSIKTFTDFPDYRNEAVIAVSRYIEEVDWGIIVKIDKQEVYDDINRAFLNILYFVMAVVAIVITLSVYFTKNISLPITLLNETVNKIIQFQQREAVVIKGNDEVAELALNFNVMTSTLFNIKDDLELSLKQIEEKNTQILKDTVRFKRWESSSFIGILKGETSGNIIDVNDTFLSMLGYTREDFSSGMINWVQVSEPESEQNDEMAFETLAESGEIPAYEKTFVGKHGEKITTLIGGATFDDDRTEFIAFIVDITNQKDAEVRINKLAFYDDLTGAKNRYSFEKDLNECLERIEDKSRDYHKHANHHFALLLINLDKFSQFNLIYNEAMADELLREVVDKIKVVLPPKCQIYRYTGDSFFVIVEDCLRHLNNEFSNEKAPSFAYNLADKLVDIIAAPVVIHGEMVNITASIGLLENYVPSISHKDLKPLLELTMKGAKAEGGNRFAVATVKEIAFLRRKFDLMFAMQSHNFLEELYLVLQPQFDTSGTITGTEALVRWSSPELGNVRPDEFIALAEQNGKIVEIDSWVVEQVCDLLATSNQNGAYKGRISVNISAKHIAQPNFIRRFTSTIEDYGVSFEQFSLELTESALVADFQLVSEKMQVLREKGVEFSIDDFGTGYSSLSYIKNLPVTELKIDKTFIDTVVAKDSYVPIVHLIIQMANALNLNIVAEGVENEVQLDYLKAQEGKIAIQGYYFSKPLCVDEWVSRFITK